MQRAKKNNNLYNTTHRSIGGISRRFSCTDRLAIQTYLVQCSAYAGCPTFWHSQHSRDVIFGRNQCV